MDRIQRAYAHTAWTPLDPLHGLDPDMRRALLLMPPTFRERFKVAPWTSRDQRRHAVTQILAERRLAYELLNPEPALARQSPVATPLQPLTPYYQQRLAQLHEERRQQDFEDWRTDQRARDDLDRRHILKERLRELFVELDALMPDTGVRHRLIDAAQSKKRPEAARVPSKQKRKERGR